MKETGPTRPVAPFVYRHKGTGDVYYLINAKVRMKDPGTREWVPAVLYEDKNRNPYVRSGSDFYERFEKVEDYTGLEV